VVFSGCREPACTCKRTSRSSAGQWSGNWYYEVTPAVVEVTYEVPLIGDKEPPVVFVRLDQAKWGDQELTLQTFAPTSGRLISINPSKVKVHVEPIVSKLMPVNLLNMKVEPGQVIVTGPETAVAKVADIKTESPVSGAEVMQLKAIAVDKSGNLVENVKISPDLLTVTISKQGHCNHAGCCTSAV